MSLAKETAEKMLRLLEEAWQQGHDEAIAALRSEPPVLRYKVTAIWDDEITLHEGVYKGGK